MPMRWLSVRTDATANKYLYTRAASFLCEHKLLWEECNCVTGHFGHCSWIFAMFRWHEDTDKRKCSILPFAFLCGRRPSILFASLIEATVKCIPRTYSSSDAVSRHSHCSGTLPAIFPPVKWYCRECLSLLFIWSAIRLKLLASHVFPVVDAVESTGNTDQLPTMLQKTVEEFGVCGVYGVCVCVWPTHICTVDRAITRQADFIESVNGKSLAFNKHAIKLTESELCMRTARAQAHLMQTHTRARRQLHLFELLSSDFLSIFSLAAASHFYSFQWLPNAVILKWVDSWCRRWGGQTRGWWMQVCLRSEIKSENKEWLELASLSISSATTTIQ